jgi:hypothetical protein
LQKRNHPVLSCFPFIRGRHNASRRDPLNPFVTYSRNGRTIAPFTQSKRRRKGLAGCFSRFDSGKLPKVFAKGNGKLPFFAFSSLPGIDCPQAGACLYGASGDLMGGFCYSFKAWRYPAAFFRQLVNSLRLRTESGRDEIVKAWFALPKGATVRLYVDGDFASPEILSFWMRLCVARPDLQIYGYSKSWRLLLSHDKASGGIWPRNYLLNLSSGGSGTEAEKEAVSRLPIARGEFIAIATLKDHGKAYQSRKNAGFADMRGTLKRNRGGKSSYVRENAGIALPPVMHAGRKSFAGFQLQSGFTDKANYSRLCPFPSRGEGSTGKIPI